MAEPMRIARILSLAGTASRRKAEELIRAGAVQVNGHVVVTPAQSADPTTDDVRVHGRPIGAQARQRRSYVLLHKPRGYVSTRQDEAGRLWDVLNMLRFAVRANGARREILFRLFVRNDNRKPRLMTLKAVCAPSDDVSPCITICEPGQD